MILKFVVTIDFDKRDSSELLDNVEVVYDFVTDSIEEAAKEAIKSVLESKFQYEDTPLNVREVELLESVEE